MKKNPAQVDADADALEAYQAAQWRAKALRDFWDGDGQPVLCEGAAGQPRPHPLLGLIKDAELLADKLRQRVMIKYAGPDPVSVIGKAPSARRLEAVHKKPAG